MIWTALIPFKPAGQRKTRLADHFSIDERDRLSERMLYNVSDVLARSRQVSSIVLLSDRQPEGWQGRWIRDRGRGLNPELMAARTILKAGPLLIIHADLPLLGEEDVGTLLEAAILAGCAIAPDRHGIGTNALAIHDGRPFDFGFGPQSFRFHCAEANGKIGIVERRGLTLDIDTQDDLNAAIATGFSL